MSVSEPPPAAPSGAAAQPASAQIELNASVASIELSVVGADFKPLASAIGRLDVAVPAGIYQVVARAGPVVQRTLISVAAGETYRDDRVEVRFPAPAPVNDTTTTHEYHESAVERASGIVGQMAGPPAGLVLIYRDVRGTEGPPLLPPEVACFSLRDQQLNELPGFEQGWQLEPGAAIATWSGRLAPGGYALRTDPTRLPAGQRTPPSSQAFDQSIWLSEGWQTIVFITTGSTGPHTWAASIHMTQLGIVWSPYDTNVGLALELANWGLREGRSVVPNDLLNILLNTKFVNPMLGIVGAHSLLLRSDIDWNVLDTVLYNLEQMVPGHPDVIALRWMAARGRAAAGPVPGQPQATTNAPAGGALWPPMLLASYRALIAMDALDADAIADGSPAELAAANLLVQGIWTSWTPVVPAPAVGAAPPVAPTGSVALDERAQAPAPADVVARIGEEPALLEKVVPDDAATARVASYLSAISVLEGEKGRRARFATLTAPDIALATTLPVATVGRSLSYIGSALGVPSATTDGGAGGSGGTHSGGLMAGGAALVIAGAVLLAGAVGVAAWCVSSDGCPLRVGAAGGPTQTPTEPATGPPTGPPVTPRQVTNPPPTKAPKPTPVPTASITPPPPTPIPIRIASEIDFGEVAVGGLPAFLPLTVAAPEPVPLTFAIQDRTDGVFTVDPACEWTTDVDVPFGCIVQVGFTPPEATKYAGSVSVLVGDEIEPRGVGLFGQGVPLFLRYSDVLEFGTVFIGRPVTNDVTIFSDQAAPITFAVLDDEFGAYSTTTSCEWILTRDGLSECTVQVTLNPPSQADYVASLGIFVTGEPEPRRISLIGTGAFLIT